MAPSDRPTWLRSDRFLARSVARPVNRFLAHRSVRRCPAGRGGGRGAGVGQLAVGGVLPGSVGDRAHRRSRRARHHRGPAPLDQRRPDDPVLLRHRPRDQAGAHQRAAHHATRRRGARRRSAGRDGGAGGCCSWRSTSAAPVPAGGASRWPPTSPSPSACSRCSAAGCPAELKVLLLGLAIVDDVGAIVVIAVVLLRRHRRAAGSPRPPSGCWLVVGPAAGPGPVPAGVRRARLRDLVGDVRVRRPRHHRRRRARAARPGPAVPARGRRRPDRRRAVRRRGRHRRRGAGHLLPGPGVDPGHRAPPGPAAPVDQLPHRPRVRARQRRRRHLRRRPRRRRHLAGHPRRGRRARGRQARRRRRRRSRSRSASASAGSPRGSPPATSSGMAGIAGIGFTVSIFVAALAFDDAALSRPGHHRRPRRIRCSPPSSAA